MRNWAQDNTIPDNDMADNAGNIYIPGGVEDLPAKLAASIEPLRVAAFPVTSWDQARLMRDYLTVKNFTNAVKIVTALDDPIARDELYALGIRRNFWSQNHNCTPSQFYKFCMWLRSMEGSEAMGVVQKQVSLRKKARPGQDIETLALVQLLNLQLADLAVEKKGRRVEIDELVDEHRRQIAMLLMEQERVIAQAEIEFRPASVYEPLNEQDLTRICVEKYEADCEVNAMNRMEYTEANIEMLRDRYATQVREEHQHAFCKQGENEGDLRAYAQKRILWAVEAGEPKVASSFRRYLAATGGEVAPEVREEAETAPVVERAGRERGCPRGRYPQRPVGVLTRHQARARQAGGRGHRECK
ncbi:ORF1p [Salix suchowensis]|nr:ORF1p [Salix suchowensis]